MFILHCFISVILFPNIVFYFILFFFLRIERIKHSFLVSVEVFDYWCVFFFLTSVYMKNIRVGYRRNLFDVNDRNFSFGFGNWLQFPCAKKCQLCALFPVPDPSILPSIATSFTRAHRSCFNLQQSALCEDEPRHVFRNVVGQESSVLMRLIALPGFFRTNLQGCFCGIFRYEYYSMIVKLLIQRWVPKH